MKGKLWTRRNVVDIVSAAEPHRGERRPGYQAPGPGDLFQCYLCIYTVLFEIKYPNTQIAISQKCVSCGRRDLISRSRSVIHLILGD